MSTTSQIADALEKSGIPFTRVEGVANGIKYWGLSVRHENVHAEVRECSKWVEMKAWHYTPEQFMDMLVGAGMCHIEVKDNLAETDGMGDTWLECDECHWQMRLEPTTPRFSYCPNCRRKVVERMKVKDNPSACVDQRERGTRTCKECYFSHVNDRNQWTGTQRCFDAGCIAMRELGIEVRP